MHEKPVMLELFEAVPCLASFYPPCDSGEIGWRPGWVRQELPPGPFSRVVALPGAVQAAEALASQADGVLLLRLPGEPAVVSLQ